MQAGLRCKIYENNNYLNIRSNCKNTENDRNCEKLHKYTCVKFLR